MNQPDEAPESPAPAPVREGGPHGAADEAPEAGTGPARGLVGAGRQAVTWIWRERAARWNVLIAATIALVTSVVACLLVEVVVMTNSDCSSRGILACLELAVLVVFGMPPFATLYLWQMLRLVRVPRPGLVAAATFASFVLLLWADRFGLPVLDLVTRTLPWLVGIPALVTLLTAGWTALVCAVRRAD